MDMENKDILENEEIIEEEQTVTAYDTIDALYQTKPLFVISKADNAFAICAVIAGVLTVALGFFGGLALGYLLSSILMGALFTVYLPKRNKKCILSILCGLDNNYQGQIETSPNLKLGYMLQSDNLFQWRTIYKNCLLGLELNKKLNKENIDYVNNLINTYDLKEFKKSYPSNLSGGMRQRVE